MNVLLVVQLVLVGLLAGEEFIVRWGVQPAMAALPDDAHVRTRIAMVRSLRVVVPALMVPAVLASVAVLVLGGTRDGAGWRIAATAALVVFVLASFLGTVPINIGSPTGTRRTLLRTGGAPWPGGSGSTSSGRAPPWSPSSCP